MSNTLSEQCGNASLHLKWKYQFEEIFDVYLVKKQLHSFYFPWHIANILQNSYSGYFGQACLQTQSENSIFQKTFAFI